MGFLTQLLKPVRAIAHTAGAFLGVTVAKASDGGLHFNLGNSVVLALITACFTLVSDTLHKTWPDLQRVIADWQAMRHGQPTPPDPAAAPWRPSGDDQSPNHRKP